VIVHVAGPAPMLPPVKVIVAPVPVTAPPHCGVVGVLATVRPDGSVSVKANKPVKVPLGLGLVMVKVSVLLPPTTMLVGLNAFVSAAVFGAVTIRLAVLLTPPAAGTSVVVTPLVVFGLDPIVLLVTNTVSVQLLLAAMVIPVNVRAVAPLVKLLAAPQLPPGICAPLIAMLTSVSLKLAL